MTLISFRFDSSSRILALGLSVEQRWHLHKRADRPGVGRSRFLPAGAFRGRPSTLSCGRASVPTGDWEQSGPPSIPSSCLEKTRLLQPVWLHSALSQTAGPSRRPTGRPRMVFRRRDSTLSMAAKPPGLAPPIGTASVPQGSSGSCTLPVSACRRSLLPPCRHCNCSQSRHPKQT